MHAPIINYSLTYWLVGQSQEEASTTETPNNSTFIILDDLATNWTYNVVVRGRNFFGLGAESLPGIVVRTIGSVPPAPEVIVVDVRYVENKMEALVEVLWEVSHFACKERCILVLSCVRVCVFIM